MTTKLNLPLFQAIIQEVRKEPLRLDMDYHANTSDRLAPCGTTACIAGWAIILEKIQRTNTTVQAVARKIELRASRALGTKIRAEAASLLGLDYEQADRLFMPDVWPEPFKEQYTALWDKWDDLSQRRWLERDLCLPLRKQMTKLALKRLAYFLKTKGAD